MKNVASQRNLRDEPLIIAKSPGGERVGAGAGPSPAALIRIR